MKSAIELWEPSGSGPAPDSGGDGGFAPESEARDEALERHGSWIISAAFHVALFIMLMNSQLGAAKSAEIGSAPIRVVLNPEPPPEAAMAEPAPAAEQPAQPAPPPPPPSAPATTTADPKDANEKSLDKEVEALALRAMKENVSSAGLSDEGPEDAVKNLEPSEKTAELATADAKPKEAPEPTPTRELTEDPNGDKMLAAPTSEARREEEERFVKELASQTRGAVQEKGAELAKRGSGEIADRLQKLSVGRQAKKWLTETEGVGEGVIRSLDVADAPPDVAKSVLERYGIKILIKELDGSPDRYNFLNQAKTSGGTFDSKAGRGVYQVFSYSQQAIARMMQLEVEAMRRRGYDPEKTRLVEVSFGVVNTTRGYDLGVKDLKAVSMTEEQPKK